MIDILNAVFDKLYPGLTGKSRDQIIAISEKITFPKGSRIAEKGKRNQYEYILLDGIVRSFLLDQEGEAVTLLFFEKQTVLSPYVTRTCNGVSLINLEALADCHLARIDAGQFEKLIEENLEIREFANTILRQELFRKTNKEIRLISWTGKQRLEQFRKDYSMLENIIPHSMVASYLGITNVSLSRLRKES